MTHEARKARTENQLDAEGLESLRPGLRLMALRALGDAESADEAAQEALARAVAALSGGRPYEQGKLPAFVTGIARHVIADQLRARRRAVSLEEVASSHHPRTDDSPLDLMISAAAIERVRAAIADLPPKDRELVRLCYFEGLTPAELADRLHEPAERIRKRKSRALERLRAAFRGSAEEGSRSGAVGDIQDGAAGGPQAAREDADA